MSHEELFTQIDRLWNDGRTEEAVTLLVRAVRTDIRIISQPGYIRCANGPVGKYIQSEEGAALVAKNTEAR